MATNRPVTARSRSSPVTVSRSRTPVDLLSPRTSTTSLFQRERDLRVGEGALLHDLARRAARRGGGRPSPSGRTGSGRWPPRSRSRRRRPRDVLVAEEEAVTGGAPADAAAGEPLLVRQPELAVGRAGGQDHGAGAVTVSPSPVTTSLTGRRSGRTSIDVVVHQLARRSARPARAGRPSGPGPSGRSGSRGSSRRRWCSSARRRR